jgi:3-deoxy-D-manno-octulosonic-acid transferase
MWHGERAAFDVLRKKVDAHARYVWFHAASLGEFEQGRPLMERLRREHPEYKILLTFFSPSGYEVRKNYDGADIICYLPLDTPINAIRFLRLIHPEVAFFIKYEFWWNYLHILKHRGVPVYSVSSIFRKEQVFFRWYGYQYRYVLRCFTHFFVQNELSKELLATLGVTNVTITGDTRFDRVLQIKEQAKQLPIVEAFKQNYKVFVAGSSWPPDEDLFIRFFNEHKDWRLIIAPHVIGEDHLKEIISKLDRKYVRYTEATLENVRDAECLIIDCFGLLSSIYRFGDISYVGGGFGVGIHNVLEAAVWNIPVLFGPNNKRFQEAQGLLQSKGGYEILDFDGFSSIMNRLMTDDKFLLESGKKAGDFVKSMTGATDMVLSSVSL